MFSDKDYFLCFMRDFHGTILVAMNNKAGVRVYDKSDMSCISAMDL